MDAAAMKTAVTVLQELMTKLGDQPKFDYTAQSGPAHMSVFECMCTARGASVRGAARSKRDAKQEAARLMLALLSTQGVLVPPPYAALPTPVAGPSSAPAPAPALPGPRSSVVLLKELCEEYHIGAPEYELVSDTGPAHLRHFTMRARVASVTRDATHTTKKQARQLAAEALYTYLRERLARHTNSFIEEEALARAHEKVMERYVNLREGGGPTKPDLGQKIADYHLGLATHIDPERLRAARDSLQGGASESDAGESASESETEMRLEAVCRALDVTLEWTMLGPKVHVVSLSTPAPELAQCGFTRAEAAAAALRSLSLALRDRPAPSEHVATFAGL